VYVVGSCKHDNESEMRVTYGLAEEILASQEEVCCLQPVVTLTPDTN